LKAKLKVKVKPKAQRTCIVGFLENGTLRVHLKDIPERGQANRGLIDFLHRKTGIPRSSIRIVSGRTSRTKHLMFEGISDAELRERLS
jgi:uncharacterized protein (TIGR00251 family)